jgi:hypothetical protein
MGEVRMKTITNTLFMFAALISNILFGLPVFLWGLYKYQIGDYVYTVAIGLDQLGGSLIYNKVNWTVSGYTHYMSERYGGKYTKFKRLINWLFADQHHCKEAYYWDLHMDAEREKQYEGRK